VIGRRIYCRPELSSNVIVKRVRVEEGRSVIGGMKVGCDWRHGIGVSGASECMRISSAEAEIDIDFEWAQGLGLARKQ
jgi:hypothetical protein